MLMNLHYLKTVLLQSATYAAKSYTGKFCACFMIFLPVYFMKQSTFLISRLLIEKYPELEDLKGSRLTECLHRLLRDPLLWKKLAVLQSEKHTKQYQAPGQFLERVDFYPYPEDWCFLSILSFGTGFSRCLIFIHLLEYSLGEKSLDEDGTPDSVSATNIVECNVYVDKVKLIYKRSLKTDPQQPQIPQYPPIWLMQYRQKRKKIILKEP